MQREASERMARHEELTRRSEENQERWAKVLSRIEALVDKWESRPGA